MSAPVPADAASPRPAPARSPDTAPLSAPRRMALLVVLLILPVTLVSLPAIFVTMFFGHRTHGPIISFGNLLHHRESPTTPAPDVSGLRNALEQNAQGVLPLPGSLAPDPIILTVRAEHVTARAERVAALARQYGGSVSEGLPQAGEKDLYADVPQTASAAFRSALTSGATASPPPPPPAASAVKTPLPVDHLEIIIRPAADDE